MEKKAMMFSSKTRPGREMLISLMPDPKNLGILEVVDVKWWDAHGNWIMTARDEKGREHTIKNDQLDYWIREKSKATGKEMREMFLKPSKGTPGVPVNIRDFEKGLEQTSAWLSKNCKFAVSPSSPEPTQNYPLAGSSLSGLSVSQDVPNMSSISSTLTNYEVLKGIRAIPMGSLDVTKAKDLFYESNDIRRTKVLSQQISSSKTIKPLIVVQDQEGLYVLEGAHRLAALSQLGMTSFPALVVVDLDN